MRTICGHCAYENSDCKGDKFGRDTTCKYYRKPNVLNAKVLIEENERLRKDNEEWKTAFKDIVHELEQSKRPESHWETEEDHVFCDNCESVFYYDENLKPGETPFPYCPVCGAVMTNGK